jgi:hypothetical protein
MSKYVDCMRTRRRKIKSALEKQSVFASRQAIARIGWRGLRRAAGTNFI